MGILDSLIGGLAGGIGGNLGGVLGKGRTTNAPVPAKAGFRSMVQIANGDAPFDTAAEVFAIPTIANQWWRIWEMTVPAQQQIAWGYGSPALPANQGYMWFYLASAAAFDIGIVRLCQEDNNRLHTIPVMEIPDATLHGLVAAIADPRLLDHNQMVAVPEKVEYALVGEDSRLAIEYFPTTLVVETQAEFAIPITRYM